MHPETPLKPQHAATPEPGERATETDASMTPAAKVAAGYMLDDVELAELIGSSPKTARNWRAKGEGPAYVKLGRLVRYTPAAIREFLAAGAREPTP